MPITREILEQTRSQLVADLNAVSGAIQAVELLLAKLDEDEPTEEEGG